MIDEALARPRALLRWRDVYGETELMRAALRVYTKPLFRWRNALATSTDGRTLYDFAAHGLRGLEALHGALRRERFVFRPALALHYNFNGRHRTIYLAPWEERMVDLLLYRVLNERLHDWLSPHAYAYRTRGFGLDRCQRRIASLLRHAGAEPLHVVKRDIADYFASVDHDVLLGQIATIVDPADHLFALLEQRVRFRYVEDGETLEASRGVPFGTAVACLLANVYLTDLDRALGRLPEAHLFRYADDLLVLSRRSDTAAAASATIDAELATLRLQLKASHRADLVIDPSPRASSVAVPEFRHLGLLFRGGGAVALSRDKVRKIQNLFRFAFRRSERRWRKLTDPAARAEALARVAAETMSRGLRNVAIIDYYLKHVDDERQWRLIDRWLAEEILANVFGGHRKGHFRAMGFKTLRTIGVPSLVHRRRLIRRGCIESSFFIWQRDKATRAFRGTVARPGRASGAGSAFSSFPKAAAQHSP